MPACSSTDTSPRPKRRRRRDGLVPTDSVALDLVVDLGILFDGQRLLDHIGFVYSSDEELLCAISSFVDDGVSHGEPVVVVADEQQSALLREGLADAGTSPAISFIGTPGGCHRPAATIAAYRNVLETLMSAGAQRVRLIEHVEPGESGADQRAWASHEAVLNRAFAMWPLSVLCPFDERVLCRSVLETVERTHPQLIHEGERTHSALYEDPAEMFRSLGSGHLVLEETAPRLEIPFDRMVGIPRRAVHDAVAPAGLTPERVEDLVLAFSEVAANALVHGSGSTFVRVWADEGVAVCTVSDEGKVFADLLAGYVPPARAELVERGKGLWLSRQLCDEVDILPGESGLTVRLVMRA